MRETLLRVSGKEVVGARGFEPPTPRSRTECSTRLSHAPTARHFTLNTSLTRTSALRARATVWWLTENVGQHCGNGRAMGLKGSLRHTEVSLPPDSALFTAAKRVGTGTSRTAPEFNAAVSGPHLAPYGVGVRQPCETSRRRVVRELGLDYLITMVSGGGSGNCEVVMWDRPRNSYFSIRVQTRPWGRTATSSLRRFGIS